jgi:peptidoglycan/LPS O-acetylase OafA/YrhL
MSVIKYRKDIEALRGLSVLLVVVFHFFPTVLPGGYVGVDVFFVISGFIITNLITSEINQNKFSLSGFYARRIRRLFPSLLLVMSFLIVFGWFFLYQYELILLGQHIYSSMLFYQNFNLIQEIGYFDVDAHYKQLLHFWSLSIEEQYYFFWPILLVFFNKCSTSPLVLLCSVSLVSFFYLVYSSQQLDNEAFFHSFSRVWELSLGAVLALSKFEINKKYAAWIFSFGLFLIVYSSFRYDGEITYLAYYTLTPVFGAIFIISSRVTLPSWGGFLWLGSISYPLYLWHWALLSSAYIYIGRVPTNDALVVLLFISLLLSVLSKQYAEKVRFGSSRLTVPLLISCALIIVSISWNIQDTLGFRNRKHLLVDSAQFTRPPSKDVKCLGYAETELTESVLFDYCRSDLGIDEDIIAVIGDSHAHSLYPGIQSYAKRNGMSSILFANSSCPTLIGFEWGRNDEEIKHCKEKINQIFTLIEQNKKIRKVIISTRGPRYIHGETPGKATIISVKKGLATYEDASRLSYDSFFAGLSKSINRLTQASHIVNIYYMLENPELDFHPKDLFRRPLDYFNISSSNGKKVDRRLYDYRMATYRERSLEFGAFFDRVRILDVRPILCPTEECIVFKENTSLYADDDHLSVFGANYVIHNLEGVMEKN